MLKLIRHNEPLEPDELIFLEKKEMKERRLFYKVVKLIILLCFFCPFFIAWWRAVSGVPNPFSYAVYFLGVLFLLCFSGVILYISYYYYLRKLQSDIHHQTKTIEQTHITRKQYMLSNNTYYFYLDSPNKLSIEVSHDDFQRLEKGDEVNIEYTTYSQLYLGYY